MFLRLQKYGKRMTQQTFCTSFSPLQKIIRNFAKVMYSLREGWKLMHSETGNRANRSRVHQSNAAYGGVVPVAHITTQHQPDCRPSALRRHSFFQQVLLTNEGNVAQRIQGTYLRTPASLSSSSIVLLMSRYFLP